MEFAGPRRGGGTAGGGKGQKVSYVSQAEPTFIRQFKERVGFKADPGLDAKRPSAQQDNFDSDEDRPEPEDEKPLVVVLRSGDLTAEEADKLTHVSEEVSKTADSGKIVFKRPKRAAETEPTSAVLGSKKNKKLKLSTKDIDSSIKTKSKQVANAKLLSFDEDDEDV